MSRVPKWVKVSFLVYAIFGMLTSSAEAAYHLTRATGEAPTPGLRFDPGLSGVVTAPQEALPEPEPVRATRQSPTRLPRLSGGPLGPSTNRFVEPNGCEAAHSQQWSPSGTYWGKYQFDRQTWRAHGGDPGAYGSADVAEQDRVASKVKYDAWPNC